MILTLRCPISSAAQINLKPKACFDRNEEEKFVVCFEQNMKCHEALRQIAAEPKAPTWEAFALVALGGLIAGLAIENRLKH